MPWENTEKHIRSGHRNKSFSVADTTNSVDTVGQNRTLAIADAIVATDLLSGSINLNKVLQITETVSLAEATQVGGGSVKKTRLFLVIGDLAVQLTGE